MILLSVAVGKHKCRVDMHVDVSLEISASTLSWDKCAPLLGARVLGFEHPLVC
jgi:hypothetical protein